MDNVNSFLVDWGIRFFENKDTIKREIISIEKGKDGFDFTIHCKDKVKYYIIDPILVNDIFSRIRNDGYFGIITLNNIKNIKFVVSEWEKLVNFKFLNIYFVNPFSSSDKVWIICPYIHDKICSKASLGQGLKSMAEMVEGTSKEELDKRIKLKEGESDQ